jgi:hypothetical protein
MTDWHFCRGTARNTVYPAVSAADFTGESFTALIADALMAAQTQRLGA